ncbi:MAG: hypothetical protein BWX64_00450 [Acidobacteria bacterium ADurb.Bin051]|jgi:hypothetical protein|nr:MAG: hypothetical protein BWX64_00450 [Acidobacteria bacterium ADurb.Bin051]
MSIKPDADQIHFLARPDERRLVLCLAEAFDATYAQELGGLSYWILDPTSRTKERFGLQKEVLAIYSRHQRTDARVLTTIESFVTRPDLRHRVEKSVFLLVHSGDEGEAAKLTKSDEGKVIIPFRSAELLSSGKGELFVRSRMAEVLGAIDLFGMSSPIVSERYFFGRTELVQQLARRLSVQKENAGLFGLRKTGKTSVLFAIRRALDQGTTLVEYLDCQSPGVHNARWWQVLGNLSCRLRDTLARTRNREIDIVGRYTPETAGTAFSSDVQRLLHAARVDHMLVMLDEIEWITPGISGHLGRHWDEDFLPFWQTIRATHQETANRLTFLVAGVNPSCVQRAHFGSLPNPVFQLATPHYLEPFSEQSVHEMIRVIGRYAGLKFDATIPGVLQRRYGGHPYLVRVACSEVWRQHKSLGPDEIRVLGGKEFDAASRRIAARLAQPIKDILLSLVWWYPDEYELLQILAGGDAEFVQEYLKESPDAFVQFASYGLLRENGDFAIADIRDFIREHGEAYKRELSPFSRSDVRPEMLPAAPDLDELGRLFAKKAELELKLRKLIVMYLGVQNGWSAEKMAHAMILGLKKSDERPEPAALFVGREARDVINDLYTADLASIICRHWDLFKNVFDDHKPRFEMNMETVNRARRVDGHTKPFTSEEINEFENSYRWVLARLKNIPLEGVQFGPSKGG